ncbi:hypothetical protein RB595_006130 [Gaeumannomyces hyphopodioides]
MTSSSSNNDQYWNSTLWRGPEVTETISLSLTGINVTVWTVFGVTITAVGLRLFSRLVMRRERLSVSDCWMLLGLTSALGFLILNTIASNILYTDGGPDERESLLLLKIQYANNYLYDPGLYYSKFALLSFYLSLIPKTSVRTRCALNAVVGFTVCGFVAVILADTFWCGPDPSANTRPEKQAPGQCSVLISSDLFYTVWAVHFTSEIMIFLFPFPIVTRLKLERRARVALCGLFGLGLLTLAMSIARVVVFSQLMNAASAAEGGSINKILYILYPAELCTSLIVVGLSACRPLLTRAAHSLHRAWAAVTRVLGLPPPGASSGQRSSGGGSSAPRIATIGSGRAPKARHGDSQWLDETRLEEGNCCDEHGRGGGAPPAEESFGADSSARSATDYDSTRMLIDDPIPLEDLGRGGKPA